MSVLETSNIDKQNGEGPPCKKLKSDSQECKSDDLIKNERYYFSSYADIELHRTMIEDQVRTNTYKDAIFFNDAEYIKDKVIADVGCGTGILSVFCAQAGAKKVYAIEASSIATQAKVTVELNGLKDKIVVLHGKAEEVELPEKVDVIVSEWMGYMLLFETMLPSVLQVRDKWLKPGGKIFPERAALYMAMGKAKWITRFEENTCDFWITVNHSYNLDMSHFADGAIAKYKDTTHVHMVGQEDIMSKPTVICDLDLYKLQASDLKQIEHSFCLKSFGSRKINCLVLWFDVWFPGGQKLSTSPDAEDTHWQNTVLPLADKHVKQDTKLQGTIKIVQEKHYYRYLNVQLEYRYDDGEKVCRIFKMDDNCSDD